MCTLSFVPLKDEHFCFTHNRDEDPNRPFTMPHKLKYGDVEIWSPTDEMAGGSWIGLTHDRVACILNGAFSKHIPNPPYRHSRGIVLKDLFTFSSFDAFQKNYDFEGLENFTMICWDKGALYALVWDGKELFVESLDTKKCHFYSSSTLYSKTQKEIRRKWFFDWILKNPEPSQDDILDFHMNAGSDQKEIALQMQRGDYIKTVCVSSVNMDARQMELYFHDLQNEKVDRFSI